MTNKLNKLVSRIAPKDVLEQNAQAFEAYDKYKETSELIERVETALGKRTAFKVESGSALHFDINRNELYSTTAQV